MIKLSSRFLMVVMLAVLATTAVLTTSTFAAGRLGPILPNVKSILFGTERGVFNGAENPGLHPGLSLETCGFGWCGGRGLRDAPSIRQHNYVEPVTPW
jgi:hypothetical protein